MHAPSPNSFIFMQFSAKRIGAPPSGKSWIHHYLDFDQFLFLLSCEQLCDKLDGKVAQGQSSGQGGSKVKGHRSKVIL